MKNFKSLYYVLGIVLVEIRGTENVKKARILSDIMHNVPAQMAAGKPEKDIVNDVMLRANRHGIEDMFSKYFNMAQQA